MGRLVIIDIDNCISDDGWRTDRLSGFESVEHGLGPALARFHAYHSLAPFDAPGFVHEFRQELIAQGNPEVAFVTARPELYRAATVEWLCRHFSFILPRFLCMRQNHDQRPSRDVKCAALQMLIGDFGVKREHIVCAYDDNDAVLRMYRDEGLATKRVNIDMRAFESVATKISEARK